LPISQLGAWVMHGLLTDPNNEFFIQAASSSSSSSSSHPQATDGEDEVALAALDDDETFTVCPERRPACVSPAVVERVLFSGVALRIMLGPQATDEDRPEEAKMAQFRREIQTMASQPVFHRASFEMLVNSLQSHASQRLYRLVVVRARLPLHLQAMKDYLLLGRGDLFQAFIENTRGLLGLTSGQGGEHDVNEPYRRAALLSYADEDEMFGRTRMMVEEGGGDAKDGKGEALDALRMHFNFDWPLGTLLFTQEVMAR
jgi:gamma-tubulin complex component 4